MRVCWLSLALLSFSTAVRVEAETMADEEEFKKYQKIMATKRTRKTERNKGI
jgi:hypothetical protein